MKKKVTMTIIVTFFHFGNEAIILKYFILIILTLNFALPSNPLK